MPEISTGHRRLITPTTGVGRRSLTIPLLVIVNGLRTGRMTKVLVEFDDLPINAEQTHVVLRRVMPNLERDHTGIIVRHIEAPTGEPARAWTPDEKQKLREAMQIIADLEAGLTR